LLYNAIRHLSATALHALHVPQFDPQFSYFYLRFPAPLGNRIVTAVNYGAAK
jgi:hypothetical protein